MLRLGRKIVLAKRPVGVPRLDDFELVEMQTTPLRADQFMVRNQVFAIDPATRGFLDDRPSYLPPVPIGGAVRSMALGEVIESKNEAVAVGQIVRAVVAWEEYSVLTTEALGYERVEVSPDIPLSYYMGTLGPSGLTAYVGLHGVGKARPGDIVAVSAAAGAVGNIVGQLAKAHGCTAVGIVGTPEKAELCRTLGFDVTIDYKAQADLTGTFKEGLPGGCDVFFDGVGGEILDTMLPLMNDFGRVVVCGMIANYNDAGNPYRLSNLWQVLVKRLRVEGYLTFDYPQLLERAQSELTRMVVEGSLRPLENVTHGIENTPEAFIRLMSGATTGKTVVTLS